MKISILCVGRIKEKYWNDAIAEYTKRLSRYCSLQIREVPDEAVPDNAPTALEAKILDTEGKRIQAHGGAIFHEGGVYYWYGENKEHTDG